MNRKNALILCLSLKVGLEAVPGLLFMMRMLLIREAKKQKIYRMDLKIKKTCRFGHACTSVPLPLSLCLLMACTCTCSSENYFPQQ